ncbi:MAG: ABC transporter permease subunit, partial [Oscillospiraceae bacterium]
NLESAPYAFKGFGGIIFVHAYTQYVHFYLQTYIALKYIDYSEIEVARGLGASKLRIFKDVIFPVIKPSIMLSAAMTFISGISSYAAPSILGNGYKVLSTQIATSKANFDFQRAAIAAIILFTMGFCMLIFSLYTNRKNKVKRNIRATQLVRRNKPKLTVGRVLGNILVFSMVLMIVLPIVGIIYLSFMKNQSILTQLIPKDFTLNNYFEIFKSKRTVDPFFNSINMSVFVVVIGLLFTVPLSYIVSKRKTFTNNLARFLVTISWSIPGSVLAVNMIVAFNNPNIFAFGNVLIGGYFILPIVYTINALPMMMNNNMIAMENFNPVLEDASRGLGAGHFQTFVKIVLPSIIPGIISGSMLAIINTLGEYTISNLLYGVHNLPISVAMLKRFTNYYFGETMAYAAIVILICGILFSIVFKLDKKIYF